jgi:hypothetical protein
MHREARYNISSKLKYFLLTGIFFGTGIRFPYRHRRVAIRSSAYPFATVVFATSSFANKRCKKPNNSYKYK